MTAALLALALALPAATEAADAGPSDQTLVYYNARMALREGKPTEAVKLWFLRTAIESKTQRLSVHDPDFQSVTWAALGELGLCQDGLPYDEEGVGLWPVAMHNWVVLNMRRPPPRSSVAPFDAFEISRQQRRVALYDVLDAQELRRLRLGRTDCLRHRLMMVDMGESLRSLTRDNVFKDKRVATRVLRHLLRLALGTLEPKLTYGRAVIAARIFDINLRLAALELQAERRERRKQMRRGRRMGLSRDELKDSLEIDLAELITPDSEEGRILHQSLGWPAEEWMAVTPDRRRFLFAYAAKVSKDPAALGKLLLSIIDRLIAERAGAELRHYIDWYVESQADDREGALRALWAGERGRRLLALDRASGFRERAVISLHRGVDYLTRGDLPASLRALAHALKWADSSRRAEVVRRLSRRWLSFVASQFRVTDALFAMLRAVVPRGDYNAVLADQLWHAALAADSESFERCEGYLVGRGTLSRYAVQLRPLATGDAGAFATGIRDLLEKSPYFAMRFLGQYLQRLQAQDAEVRRGHLEILQVFEGLLGDKQEEAVRSKRRKARVVEALGQIRSIIDGLPEGVGENAEAYQLSPDRQVFAGSLRLGPSDPLPWPFKASPVKSPTIFSRIALTPEEWRRKDDTLVFGWRLAD